MLIEKNEKKNIKSYQPLKKKNFSSHFFFFFRFSFQATVNTTTFTNRNNIIQSEILKTVPPKKEDNNNKVKQVISSLVNPRIDDILSDNQPKKSVSMNGIKSKETAPVHKKTGGIKCNLYILFIYLSPLPSFPPTIFHDNFQSGRK